MKKLNRDNYPYPLKTERVLQFGEGNFLRCFIDWQIDILNEKCDLDAGVVIVRPIKTDFPPSLNTQDGLYTTVLRGYDEEGTLRNDERIISCVTQELSAYNDWDKFLEMSHTPTLRFIFSNTTEAGIVFNEEDKSTEAPPSSFPAKLTRFLFERYQAVEGASDKGFILLPCELIDYNGDKLKEIVLKYCDLWNYGSNFKKWIQEDNIFCSTLVDRIVTGYPAQDAAELTEELGYDDSFITTGEYFHLFVIQAPAVVREELKLKDSDLNIKVVEDLKPYKVRKVGILNGCHTALFPVAFLCGLDYVKDSIEDQDLSAFAKILIENEIIPHLGLPEDYTRAFAGTVLDRFRNPFIEHQLLAISLNSMTKFKTRILPQFLNYCEEIGTPPKMMSLALAALICFYRGKRIVDNNVESFDAKDDQEFLDLYKKLWEKEPESRDDTIAIARSVLELNKHWGAALSDIPELTETVGDLVWKIIKQDMRTALKEHLL